tara:strand:- start:407 stop:556 length:150 start_codon:yes stop_codon:yes gene_type:complete
MSYIKSHQEMIDLFNQVMDSLEDLSQKQKESLYFALQHELFKNDKEDKS